MNISKRSLLCGMIMMLILSIGGFGEEKNQWSVFQEACIRWYIELPSFETLGVDSFFEFVERFAEIGQEEKVLGILQTDGNDFHPVNKRAYVNHLTEYAHSGEIIPLFKFRRPCFNFNGEYQLESVIAFYNAEGKIEEKAIKDVGALFKSFHSHYNFGIWHVSPIDVSGWLATISGDYFEDPICISLSIYTNIWFPYVYGYDSDPDDFPDGHDNRELANRHTSRFNRFLRKARQLSLNYGGTWEYEPGCYRFYKNMVAEDGIKLSE